jgi:hypothetical protein
MSSTNGVDFKERVTRESIFRKAKYRLISHWRTLAILTVGVIIYNEQRRYIRDQYIFKVNLLRYRAL